MFQQRISNKVCIANQQCNSIANQQWSLAMKYPLLIYIFNNRILATDNLLLSKSSIDNPLLKN